MFDCVIPAAGASSRMGAPGGARLKPLLPFAGGTMVETAVAAALAAGCRVLLVVGHRAAEVAAPFSAEAWRAAREGGRLLVVENQRWELGLLGSIQAALPSVAGEAFFLAHADMPYIEAAAYPSLAAARAGLCASRAPAGPETAVFASHEGRRGHPVLLPSAWIPGILDLDPRGMLKDFLASWPGILVETGAGALRDIDTPEEYKTAMEGP
jgi:molybdenum cofactor cytidylyltransferase